MKPHPTQPIMTAADARGLREYLEMTQQALADYMGIERETVSRRENGTAQIGRESEMAYRFLILEKQAVYYFENEE